jgi:hypothetical protein
MPFVLDWKGREVRDRVAAAAVAGVDATMADAVRKAKANHRQYPPASAPGERYANRTGAESASMTIKEPAVEEGGVVRGTWGADADSSLYVEIGTSRKRSGFPRAEVRAAEGEGDMWAIPPPSAPPQMAARYTLRPAAQMANQLLAARIAAAFMGEGLV